MKDTKIIGLFAVMAMMTIGLTAAPIYGQANTFTGHFSYQANYYLFWDDCNNRYVNFPVEVKGVSHHTQTPNGNTIITTNGHITGEGTYAGIAYKLNENFQSNYQQKPDGAYPYDHSSAQSKYTLITADGGNTVGNFVYKLYYNANGEVTVEFDFSDGKCIGGGQVKKT